MSASSARGSRDAKFFYETDLKTRLEARLPKFEQIVFHEKLGTQAERIERIVALAKELAPLVKADPNKAERAASLAKADLLTEVVGEFPEVQGLMGRYYARAQGEDEAVAHAIEDHYKPQGPKDLVPADPVSIAVALADKIDMLVSFWTIDEKPTGSKDPFALRRAALGVIRIVLDNNLRLSLRKWAQTPTCSLSSPTASRCSCASRARDTIWSTPCSELEGQDDLLLVVRRVDALGKFLDTDDGKNLLAGVQARSQHPAHRGEEGQQILHRRARSRAAAAGRRKGAGRRHRDRQEGRLRRRRQGRFRRRHDGDGEAAAHSRCLLRQGHRQCR